MKIILFAFLTLFLDHSVLSETLTYTIRESKCTNSQMDNIFRHV